MTISDTITLQADATLDDITANWPVPDDMTKHYRNIMATHMAQPLPVYKDGAYVQPLHVNAALKNALVEVHFSLHHYRIKDKTADRLVDSFNGIVQQIIILKEGVPKPINPYKRKNLLDGPYRPRPFESLPVQTASPPTSVKKPTTPMTPVPAPVALNISTTNAATTSTIPGTNTTPANPPIANTPTNATTVATTSTIPTMTVPTPITTETVTTPYADDNEPTAPITTDLHTSPIPANTMTASTTSTPALVEMHAPAPFTINETVPLVGDTRVGTYPTEQTSAAGKVKASTSCGKKKAP
jgi:hypothetical protein